VTPNFFRALCVYRTFFSSCSVEVSRVNSEWRSVLLQETTQAFRQFNPLIEFQHIRYIPSFLLKTQNILPRTSFVRLMFCLLQETYAPFVIHLEYPITISYIFYRDVATLLSQKYSRHEQSLPITLSTSYSLDFWHFSISDLWHFLNKRWPMDLSVSHLLKLSCT
jgi:hypothetical protein